MNLIKFYFEMLCKSREHKYQLKKSFIEFKTEIKVWYKEWENDFKK